MRLYQVVLVGLVLAVAASAQAAPILDVRIDFSDLGAAPAGTGTWNTVTSASSMASAVTAKDFSGADAQGLNGGIVTYQMTLNAGNWTNGEKTGQWKDAFTAGVSWLDSSGNAAKDSIQSSNAGTITLKFTGLDPSVTYNFQAISSDTSNYAAATLVPWTVNGANQIKWSAYTNGYMAGQVLSWDVQPDANGLITVVSAGVAGPHNSINAARLYAVTPEPATLLLLSLSLVGALRRKV